MKTVPLSTFASTPLLVSHALSGELELDFGFPLNVDSPWWRRRSEIEARHPRDTAALSRILLRQAGSAPLHDEARKNINALAKPGTLAVVTGQQTGIAGGPLLTLYKALSAIAVAKHMESESGVRTVPVFWMATSDHNYTEVSQLHWLNVNNELVRRTDSLRDNRRPVGLLRLGDFGPELIAALKADMPDTDFLRDVFSPLEAAYGDPEQTWGHAFRLLMQEMLGPYGMVVLDPEDGELKQYAKPFWQASCEEVEQRLDRLGARSDELQQAGYEVQAPVETGRPALFVLEEGVRRKVVLEGHVRRSRSDLILTKQRLQQIAREAPETLSAGVTLRPLLQGWLLPTAAYVPGPHEMAYWAQLSPAFEPLGLAPPALIHRASFTLIEKKTRRSLGKLGIEEEELFGSLEELSDRIVQQAHEDRSSPVFEEMERCMAEARSSLMALTEGSTYGGLENAVAGNFKRLEQQLGKLQGVFTDRIKRSHGDLLGHLEKAAVHISPAGKPQERVLTPFYYLARYSSRLIPFLLERCLDASGTHGFLDLEEME